MGVGASMFGGGWQEAQEVEQHVQLESLSKTALESLLWVSFIHVWYDRPKVKSSQARVENQKSR